MIVQFERRLLFNERTVRPTHSFYPTTPNAVEVGVDLDGWPDYGRSVGHELTDEISLEMGRRVAARLRQQPNLLGLAHRNLDRWTRLNANAPSLLRCYAEWREILERPLEEICALLSSDHEEARRLRQNSPFAGVLAAQEVWELKRLFRHATTAT